MNLLNNNLFLHSSSTVATFLKVPHPSQTYRMNKLNSYSYNPDSGYIPINQLLGPSNLPGLAALGRASKSTGFSNVVWNHILPYCKKNSKSLEDFHYMIAWCIYIYITTAEANPNLLPQISNYNKISKWNVETYFKDNYLGSGDFKKLNSLIYGVKEVGYGDLLIGETTFGHPFMEDFILSDEVTSRYTEKTRLIKPLATLVVKKDSLSLFRLYVLRRSFRFNKYYGGDALEKLEDKIRDSVKLLVDPSLFNYFKKMTSLRNGYKTIEKLAIEDGIEIITIENLHNYLYVKDEVKRESVYSYIDDIIDKFKVEKTPVPEEYVIG
jgi:hypothetical protein